MSKPVKVALKALAKSKEDRLAAEAREVEFRNEAAKLFGELVLEAGAEKLDPSAVEQIIRKAVELGADETIRRLSPRPRAASENLAEARQEVVADAA